jgi:hypothetical protein
LFGNFVQWAGATPKLHMKTIIATGQSGFDI